MCTWHVAHGTAFSQIDIFWNYSNKADTVMDFGVTLEGEPVTVPFIVINNSNKTVAIFNTRPDADPYLAIVNTPDVPAADPRKEEFKEERNLPYFIQAHDTGSFGIVYRALKNDPQFPPDVPTQALLHLRVVDSITPLAPSINKTFLLRAIKTNNILASTTPYIRFDSVYIQPAPQPPLQTYTVKNVTLFHIALDTQFLEMQTSVVGNPEIDVSFLPENSQFGPQGTLSWPIRYAPRDQGRDSGHFVVWYKPNPDTPDTITARVSGIGVEQKFGLVGVVSDKGSVTIKGDTIDFGDVDADGSGGVVARIAFKNEGNINSFITSETEVGSLRDTTAYEVVRPLSFPSRRIETNVVDTLIVRFNPLDGGVHLMDYNIETDLRQRNIYGVPDGAQSKRLYFRAFARRPQMQINPPSLEFGTVVLLPTCTSASERVFTIRNVGNIPLRIDSIVVKPKNAPLFVDPSGFSIIPETQKLDVTVRYIPNSIAPLDAKVVLYTNAFGVPYEMQCNGRSVPPDSITVSMPSEVRARPGHPIQVAVSVDPDRVTFAETSHLEVTFDESLLSFRGAIQPGTASEGASYTPDANTPGLVRIDLKANGAFSAKPELIILAFDTYLGDRAETDLALSPLTTKFGNTGCESILDVHTLSGLFLIDSVCGLDYQTATSVRSLLAVEVAPNPAESDARLVLKSPGKATVTYRIIDSYGAQFGTTVTAHIDKGLNIVPITLKDVAPGLYFVEVQSGRIRRTVQVVVSR